MSINRESDVAANLQIGPTTMGMVRLYIETDTVELPLDFEEELAPLIERCQRLVHIGELSRVFLGFGCQILPLGLEVLQGLFTTQP